MAEVRDTIFALSSGRPPAAIAVVRISGPRAGDALKALIGRLPAPRTAALARVRDGNGDEIDQALALWFPGPASETGEDVAELQLHGGRAVIAGTLAALAALDGLRPAEAGEFTRRGFENGKLDLTEVEGLADLVMAETQAQRRQALRQLKGFLGERAETWRGRLIAALALVEARIDFSDEADVPEDLLTPARSIARGLSEEIGAALADGGRGERLRDGLVVAIAGPPNAGKSTLLNRLARREAAIVSPYAGTTRDVIEVHLDLGGYPVTLLDTAGVRETDDPVEMEGVRRAKARAAEADLVLWVVEAGDSVALPAGDPNQPRWLVRNKIDLAVAAAIPASGDPASQQAIDMKAKNNDMAPRASSRATFRTGKPGRNESPYTNESLSNERRDITKFSINELKITSQTQSEYQFSLSATTGAGVDGLIVALKRYAAGFLSGGEPALITRARHRHALTEAQAALARAIQEPAASREDLLAEELRQAAAALGRLTGRVDVEDILDVIFRDFCIGK